MDGFALHLLRHGAPEVPGTLLGHRDAASTPAGVAACARQARDLDISAIVSSDLVRASAAAEAIGAVRGLAVRTDPRWRELDFGTWDGSHPAGLDAGALAAFWEDPEDHPPPGGERWSALLARVSAAIDDCQGAATLVVTHGGAMRAALAALCGLALPQLWAFDLPYGALLSLRVWPGSATSAQITGLRA
jgi:alpha-ribazole phosphatase